MTAPSPPRLRGRPVHPVAGGLLARTFSFVPTAIGTLLVSRLIIGHFGIPAFNGFTIAESLIVLIPLNNLGVGAAITAAFAANDPLGDDAERVTLTATRIMTLSALALAGVSLAMAAAGLWSTVLGGAAYGGWFFGLGVAFYAAGFVPGLGQAMLLGVHRNHVTILVQSLIMPVALAMVAVFIAGNADGRLVVIVPAASLAAANVLTMVVATRLTHFRWRSVLAKLPRPHRYAGARIRGIAGPQLVANITVPLALASDLVILSHFSTSGQVADYGICLQLFAPLTALVAAAAAPLWPIYIAAKAKGSTGPRVSRTVLGFSGSAAVICALLVPIAPLAGRVISNGQVRLGIFLPLAAALMTVVYSAAYPVGMALTTPKELRFLATVSAIALPLNVGVSIVLARTLGAPGPLLATAAVGLAQITSAAYYLRTHAPDRSALTFPPTRADHDPIARTVGSPMPRSLPDRHDAGGVLVRAYGPGRPLVFSHIPKTAGTSLRGALHEILQPTVSVDGLDSSLFGGYDDYDDIRPLMRSKIFLSPDELPADATLVAAHISPWTTMERYPGADHITILRTPQVRLISQFLHCRSVTDFDLRRWGSVGNAFRAGWGPLRDYLQDPMVAPNADNTITRFLTWPHVLVDKTSFIAEAHDEALFAAAIDRLESFGHVNVVENPGFMSELGAWLGQQLPENRLNERMWVPRRMRPDLAAELDAGTRDLLDFRCRIDLRVWAYALRLVLPDADPDEVRARSMQKAVDRYSTMLLEPDHTRPARRAVARLYDVGTKIDPRREPVRS